MLVNLLITLLLSPFMLVAPQTTIRQDALDAHNTYRSWHQAPNLTWSDSVELSAQDWANRCVFEHSSSGNGENLALGHPSIRAAIKAWYDEVVDYDFANPGFFYNTGHFTQVVWKNTQKLGCAKGNCANLGNLWVCQYYPPGNYRGQFPSNVLPKLPTFPEASSPPPAIVINSPPPLVKLPPPITPVVLKESSSDTQKRNIIIISSVVVGVVGIAVISSIVWYLVILRPNTAGQEMLNQNRV